ncbi:MAG: hypothetical protein HY709_01630, partial [Candidatus Latescibacteria bacterium]|nr:hypothetical protein [Candidatus Latescibacterota bacterium]
MGNVDFHFKPVVPVFDANVALGRRHDRRVGADRLEDVLAAMDRAGVERALAHSPYATQFDAVDGNRLLCGLIGAE